LFHAIFEGTASKGEKGRGMHTCTQATVQGRWGAYKEGRKQGQQAGIATSIGKSRCSHIIGGQKEDVAEMGGKKRQNQNVVVIRAADGFSQGKVSQGKGGWRASRGREESMIWHCRGTT